MSCAEEGTESSNNCNPQADCELYLAIWKEILLSSSQVSEDYFDEHVVVNNYQLIDRDFGRLFQVYYDFKVDWFESNQQDQFAIFVNEASARTTIEIPYGLSLDQKQIEQIIEKDFYSSNISKMSAFDTLLFSSQKEAINTINESQSECAFSGAELYLARRKSDLAQGNPILRSRCTIDVSQNICKTAILDLLSGELIFQNVPCVWQ
jgi:hypothetical protein